MNLRVYLEEHKDPKQLPRLLEQVIDGVESLHHLGYFHRDLKLDNIVITLRPLNAKLIDIDIAQLRVAMTSGQVKGTTGYYPVRPNLKNGSTAWDIWAIAGIILECDMRPGEYYGVFTDRGGKLKEEEH